MINTEAITSLVVDLMPLFMGLIFTGYALKYLKKYLKRKSEKKKVDKPRDEADRVYTALKEGAKREALLKHVPVYLTGDEAVKDRKLGETATGVLAGNDEVIFFMRKRWWKIWEKAICVRVEPELVGDLNAGELVIKGRGLDPLSSKYFHIEPPTQYFEDIDPSDVAKRRSQVSATRYKKLLNDDLNRDRSYAVKHAIRGGSQEAKRELFLSSAPPTVTRKKLDKEQERKEKELEQSSQSSNQQQQTMMGG